MTRITLSAGSIIHPPFPCVSYKVYPDGSACTARDYAGLLCNNYWDAGLKCCHHPQTSPVQSPLNPFYTWCNMLLIGLHHSLVGGADGSSMYKSPMVRSPMDKNPRDKIPKRQKPQRQKPQETKVPMTKTPKYLFNTF